MERKQSQPIFVILLFQSRFQYYYMYFHNANVCCGNAGSMNIYILYMYSFEVMSQFPYLEPRTTRSTLYISFDFEIKGLTRI